MFDDLRWFEDDRFFAPMGETPVGPVFICDVVKILGAHVDE